MEKKNCTTYFPMLLIAVIISFAKATDLKLSNVILPGPSLGASCHEIDFDAISLIPNGTVWQRRCHNCQCLDGDIVCRGPQCMLDYDPTFEYTCTRWTSDECCCEHVGCLIAGEHVDLEAWYHEPDTPCVTCQCSIGRRMCQMSSDCNAIPVQQLES